ncbi:MAG: ABC transporter permease [Sphaerochaetaceae bacterium]|jgi:NitT/TauT family transport system permease protein
MPRSTLATKVVVVLSLLLLLGVWHIGSLVLDAQVILPTPSKTLSAFITLLQYKPLSVNLLTTVGRALKSFLIIVTVGSVLGIIAGYKPLFSAALQPLLVMCKAIPVMSIILLAFIWFSSGTVPLFSAFLMGFPVMFVQVEEGVRLISEDLSEMSHMYHFSQKDRIMHLIIPSLTPSLITGAKASLSMVWKVVIAAEVLTVPRYGVGSRMQLAQINLETAEVLAWTLIAILLTALGDVLFIAMLQLPKRFRELKTKHFERVHGHS